MSSRRLIFSMIRLQNPCWINLRIPMFLTMRLRERLGWTSGSRARLALVYSMGSDALHPDRRSPPSVGQLPSRCDVARLQLREASGGQRRFPEEIAAAGLGADWEALNSIS
jgi:hypothetical protein